MTDAQLATRARTILDGIYRDELAAWRSLFETRADQGRATTDIAQSARAATAGAIETVPADIDDVAPGRLGEAGAVVFAEEARASPYALVDGIVRRVIATGCRGIAVRTAALILAGLRWGQALACTF